LALGGGVRWRHAVVRFTWGAWAAQAYLTTDGWCLSRVYSSEVLSATSD